MKNYFLRSFWGILFLVLSFACSKSSDPEPDAASIVAGEYRVTEMIVNGLTITEAMIKQANGTVTITITRKDANKINFKFYANIGGQISDTQSEVLVEKSGTAVVLKDLGQQVGKYQDGKLEFGGTSGNDTVNLKAIRK